MDGCKATGVNREYGNPFLGDFTSFSTPEYANFISVMDQFPDRHIK